MNKVQDLFLQALKAALLNEKVTWEQEITSEEWGQLFHMANVHNIIPMIYEAVFLCPAFAAIDPNVNGVMKRQTTRDVMIQTMKTAEFLGLYRHLAENDLKPLVVKGILCRTLYPNPDYRSSSDEDILIPEGTFAEAHRLFTDYGMVVADPNCEMETTYEVPYGKPGSPCYIEMHKNLFPPESEAYGEFNQFFENVFDNTIEIMVDGTAILSMSHTDHLLYLICHAFKHFLHSGFGLRQVCDIALYAQAYGEAIDWEYLLDACRDIRADLFAAAMFRIAEKYLVFDPQKACMSQAWAEMKVDETEMLMDLLESGIYGQADMSRKHSSNMTLNALIADKRGEATKSAFANAMSAAFLPRKSLQDRYTYLKKFPFLLPVAWFQRIWNYRKETSGNKSGNNAADSIRIGQQRVELLRKYGIIK